MTKKKDVKFVKLEVMQNKLTKVKWGDDEVNNCIQFQCLGSVKDEYFALGYGSGLPCYWDLHLTGTLRVNFTTLCSGVPLCPLNHCV